MKAPFSDYLTERAPALKELVGLLRQSFEYVSVLATDSVGISVRMSQASKSVSGSNMTTERGVVVRVCREGRYSEYAMNDWDAQDIPALAERIARVLEQQFALLKAVGSDTYTTGLLPDEPCTLFVEKNAEILPEKADPDALVKEMMSLSDRGM